MIAIILLVTAPPAVEDSATKKTSNRSLLKKNEGWKFQTVDDIMSGKKG